MKCFREMMASLKMPLIDLLVIQPPIFCAQDDPSHLERGFPEDEEYETELVSAVVDDNAEVTSKSDIIGPTGIRKRNAVPQAVLDAEQERKRQLRACPCTNSSLLISVFLERR